ncbi:helix-turn-helix domain-containing protein [Streptomyces sp. LZ34]
MILRGGERWSAGIGVAQLGPVRIVTIESDPIATFRTPAHIAADGRDFLMAHMQRAGTSTVHQDGRAASLGPGDLTFYDASHPFTVVAPERYQAKIVVIPRRTLGVAEHDLRSLTAQPIHAGTRLPALLLPIVSRLADEGDAHSNHVREQLARTVTDLLATLAADSLDGKTPCARDADHTQLARVRGYIDRHLADSGLSPEAIARHHGMSVRYLHKLFQEQGTTVGRWIRQRRLEECRKELARRGRASRTVAAVARRWGFISPAHFSRVFRAAYGMSPSEWQALWQDPVLPERQGRPGPVPRLVTRRPGGERSSLAGALPDHNTCAHGQGGMWLDA